MSKGILFKRKPVRDLSFRRRHGMGHNLTSNDQVLVKRSEQMLIFLMVLQKQRPKDSRLEKIFRMTVCRHLTLTLANDKPFDKVLNKKRSIESFGIGLKKDFRFETADLYRLLKELKFPAVVRFKNRIKMSGEEILLRGLYELVSGEAKHSIADKFGRDFSAQSRAFNFFIDHVFNNFHHLVHDNLNWWKRNGFWEQSAAAIEARMEDRYTSDKKNLVSHFIDCNCLPACVTGGGPAEGGANAARWSDDIQRSFYNGWKSIHGIKHQTVDNAFGFTEDMYGPTSVRRNDLILLRLSNINQRFATEQAGNDDQFIIFGDSAYGRESHLTSYRKRIHMIDEYIRWNKQMKHVRISIEWNYGVCGNLFRMIRNKSKLKLFESTRISKLYTVATLFRNFHAACYGNQSSNYFHLNMPMNMLENYINQQDFNEV